MRNESFASIVPEHIVARNSVESNLLQPRCLGEYESGRSLTDLQALFDSVPGQKYQTALEGRGKRQTLTVTQQLDEDRSSIGEEQEGKVDIQTVFSVDGLIAAVKTHREGGKIPDTLVTFEYKTDSKDRKKKRLASSSAYFVNEDGESQLAEKVTYTYTRTKGDTVVKAKTETSKSYGIFSLLTASPTESLAAHQQKIAEAVGMSHEYPNIIAQPEEDGSTTLFVFVLGRGGERGMFVTPTSFSAYRYRVQDNILQSTTRLGKMFQASAINEMDVTTAQSEQFTTTFTWDLQSGKLSEQVTQREYVTYRTDFKNDGPQAQPTFIE